MKIVIDIPQGLKIDFENENWTALTCAEMKNALMNGTPLSKGPRWIPVSERLPEEFKSVLVCYKSQGGIDQTVSERLTNMDGSNRWSALAGVEPIAWMPLPEPYKTESEDKK